MDRDVLDIQADAIEAICAQHAAPVSVGGGVITPRYVRFALAPEPGTRLAHVQALAGEIAQALGVPHVSVSHTQGMNFAMDVERERVQYIDLLGLLRRMPPAIPAYTPVLGLGNEGEPILARLDAPEVRHILVSGESACDILRSLVCSLAVCHISAHMLLFAPQGAARSWLAGMPNTVDAGNVLDWARALLSSRRVSRVTSPRVVLVVTDVESEDEPVLAEIIAHGHGLGVHVLAAVSREFAGDQVCLRIHESDAPDAWTLVYGSEVFGGVPVVTSEELFPARIDEGAARALIAKLVSRASKRLGLETSR